MEALTIIVRTIERISELATGRVPQQAEREHYAADEKLWLHAQGGRSERRRGLDIFLSCGADSLRIP
jgi:hypothetical protein